MMTFLKMTSWILIVTCLATVADCLNNDHHKVQLHQQALFSASLCPVLESISISDGFYNYPLDIYGLKHNNTDLKSFPCESIDQAVNFPNMTKNTCSNHKTCPVHHDFLVQTKNNTRFRSSVPLLCKIADAIQQNATKLNFFVFGGSVTCGVLADGCNIKNDCGIDNPVSAKQYNHPCVPCAWPHYVEMWIQKALNKNHSSVQVHNLALSAHNSAQMAERLYDQLSAVGIKQLSQNDVIFIDHSSNDHAMNTPIRSARMIKGLETLIRKLYVFSDPYSLPSIILLGTQIQNRKLPQERWYTTQYQKIADHYNLTFWNFDEFYTSNYLHNANLTYTKYITRMYNGGGSAHPPWHVQLFDADMIAAMFSQEIMECEKLPSATRVVIIDKYYVNNINQLPAPLFPVDNSDQCEKSNELFHISFDRNVTHKDSVAVDNTSGSWQSEPSSAWQLRLDARGRAGGFIHEYDAHRNNSENATTAAELVFTLPLTKAHKQNIIVTLTIFRTYENAGVVTLHYCGKEVGYPNIGRLDALWSDHASYRYSLPESHSFLLPAGLCTATDSTDKVDKNEEMANKNATFSLIHNKVPDRMLVRGNQKFKLYSITVCTTKDGM